MVYLEALLSSDFISYFFNLTFDVVKLNFSLKNYDYISITPTENKNETKYF